MKISAIVCEYNPFHNGHKYLAEQLRKDGSTHIVSVMSGNFVQRGECAVSDKYSRAETAVLSGIDLVLELPVVYSCASAERFSYGAVYTLMSLGCIDELCFGSECGDIDALRKTAALSDDADFIRRIISYKSQGYSHPRAVEAALRDTNNNISADLLKGANNTLAVEYIKALNKLNINIIPKTVKRKGTTHDSTNTSDNFASASLIRKMIYSNDTSYKRYVPLAAYRTLEQQKEQGLCPAKLTQNERSIISALRLCTLEQIRATPDVTEGLEHRLYKAVSENITLEGIIEQVKCKRYTYARISRIIMCIYLGITKDMYSTDPQYLRVLAFNSKGTEVLKQMKRTAALPVVMRPSKDFDTLSAEGKTLLSADIRASDLYSLFTPTIQPCGKDFFLGALKVESGKSYGFE